MLFVPLAPFSLNVQSSSESTMLMHMPVNFRPMPLSVHPTIELGCAGRPAYRVTLNHEPWLRLPRQSRLPRPPDQIRAQIRRHAYHRPLLPTNSMHLKQARIESPTL
jgi:hypothetical protein